MATPAWCRRRAAELGDAVAEVVGVMMEVNALYRLRQAQGVVRLADKYGPERLDAACARAITVGDPSYRTVKGILVAGTEHDGDDRGRDAAVGARPSARPRRSSSPPAAGVVTRTHQLEDSLRR